MKKQCPICSRQSMPTYEPFCSKRCLEQDLGHWPEGKYAIAGEAILGEQEEGAGETDTSSHIKH